MAAAAIPPLLYGLRLSASVCLALLVAFWAQLDNAYWAATSACIVAQPALGASLRKGRFRAIGTVTGAIAIVLLTAVFPQERVGLLVSLTLWIAICGYLATILPNFAGYAAALAGYTAAVIFGGITDNPDNVFLVAVWRTTEIGIGILSAGLVHSLTDFGNARVRLARSLVEIGRGIASGLATTLRAGEETLELRTSRRALIGRAIGLDGMIDESIGEPSHLRHQRGRLQGGFEALFVALSSWRCVGNHLRTRSHLWTDKWWVAILLPSIQELAERNWLSNPEEIRALCRYESRRVHEGDLADVSSRLLVDSVSRVFRALEGAVDAVVAITQAGGNSYAAAKSRLYVADYQPALVSAVRIVLAVVAAEMIWILTSWPQGPTMITFTAVNVILPARQADAAHAQAADYTIGCFIAGVVASVLDLAILPRLDGGALVLSLGLTLVLLPLGALSAGPWRRTLFGSAVANVMPIVAIENRPTYDAALVLNSAVAVSAGAVLAVIFFRFLPPLSPRRRIQRLLELTLRDLRRLAARRRCFTQATWLGLVAARLAAVPKETSLEEEAELLATLSVGEAVIALIAARRDCRDPGSLDHALACLAYARIAEARESFVRISVRQSRAPPREGQATDIAVECTLIADALQRHQRFFSTAR